MTTATKTLTARRIAPKRAPLRCEVQPWCQNFPVAYWYHAADTYRNVWACMPCLQAAAQQAAATASAAS